ASKETWVKAVLPWRTWMRNQWIMAAGVKRQLSHHEWPAWRQAWWMKSQPSLAARSCLRVLRVVEIRRCIAGPPGPWWVRKIPLCTGVPLFSRDEAAWGYRCLNAIRLHVHYEEIHNFKQIMALYYQKTYKHILSNLLTGNLIHADETNVNFQIGKGYIWVLANMKNVVYVYRPNRDGDWLQELLS